MNEGINRRNFLFSTAAAGAGMVLSPQVMAQTGGKKKDTINVAILGCGAQGQVLMDACLAMDDPNVRFVAVCDICLQPTACLTYAEGLQTPK